MATNATEYVRSTQQLFQHKMSGNVKHCISYIGCKAFFDELIKSKTISRDIYLSRNGISLFHLHVANRRDPKEINFLLQQLKISAKTASALEAYFSVEQ